MIISVEGIGGCGKTTLIDRLHATWPGLTRLRQPWSCRDGQDRSDPLVPYLNRFFQAAQTTQDPHRLLIAGYMIFDRYVQMERHWDEGECLLLDRHIDTASAYQGVTLRTGHEPHPFYWVDYLDQIQQAIIPAPDLTLFVRVSPETAAARRAARAENADHGRAEAADRFADVAKAYDWLFGVNRGWRCERNLERVVVVDGEQDADHVFKEACWAIEARFDHALLDRLHRG